MAQFVVRQEPDLHQNAFGLRIQGKTLWQHLQYGRTGCEGQKSKIAMIISANQPYFAPFPGFFYKAPHE